MFRGRLNQIIDMGHAKAVLARQIDWRHLAERFGECYSDEPGHPAPPTRLMAGLQILKYTEKTDNALKKQSIFVQISIVGTASAKLANCFGITVRFQRFWGNSKLSAPQTLRQAQSRRKLTQH